MIEADERRMIAGVMRLGDRAVRAVMTPRTEVDWINLQDDEAAARKVLMDTPHSRLPADEGGVDAMVGVVQTRDVLGALLAGQPLDLRRHVRPAPIVHDQADALRRAGHAQGIATCRWRWSMTNTATSKASSRRPTFSKRSPACSAPTSTPATGSGPARRRLVAAAGYMPADEMADHLGIDLPETRDYRNRWPAISWRMHRLPQTGETRRRAGLALRSRRPRRPPHRQGDRHPAARQPPRAPLTGAGFELSTKNLAWLGRRPARGMLWLSYSADRAILTRNSGLNSMKIAVLGGDGFVGWPTSLHLSDQGHEIHILDNLSRRWIDTELGVQSLTPMDSIQERTRIWHPKPAAASTSTCIDLAKDYELLKRWLAEHRPDAVIHFAEQRAAPYSMKSDRHKNYTVNNNVNATHNLLNAMVETDLDAHLVHLGTMGVYGYSTVGAAIPEGYLPVGDRDARRRDASTRRSSIRPIPARSTT